MAVGANNIKPSFDPAAFGRIDGLRPGGAQPPKDGGAPKGVDFKKALEEAVTGRATTQTTAPNAAAKTSEVSSLKFSNHAIDRMRSRGITFGAEEMKRIENGIAKAAAKGSKDSLVLSGENALIVSVKNNTIVTVMDKTQMKDNVFTNIDSTVVV